MTSALQVTIPATLASGARLCDEDSMFIISRIARALDRRGSSRTSLEALGAACEPLFSAKHYRRLLEDARGSRYWALEAAAMVLRGEARVLASFEGVDVIRSRAAVSFPVAILDTRQRRGAALVAAVLAGSTDPRSNAFIQRYAGVDRKTISLWLGDPVIAENIFARQHEYALGAGRRIQLPNTWTTAAPARSSFRLGKALRSRPSDAGAKSARRRYFEDVADLTAWVAGRSMDDLAAVGSLYVRTVHGWQQFSPTEAQNVR